MISTCNTQSLTDFRQSATKTLDRINETGEAEIITVNGEARAVLLSPIAYDLLAREAEVSQDVGQIRQAMQEFQQGKGRPAKAVLGKIRDDLLATKKRLSGRR